MARATASPAASINSLPAPAAREHVRRVAESRARTREREKVTVECTTDGIPNLRKGMVVEVVGVTVLHAVPSLLALFGRDVPMIQGTALCMGVLFVSFNLLVDSACLALDPRQRLKGAP